MKQSIVKSIAGLAIGAVALGVGCSSGTEDEPGESANRGLPEHPALMAPVDQVYEHYFAIQTAMAKDSLEGVKAEAEAIAQAAKDDPMAMLPAEVADQAQALANAEDIEAAREALKPLSASLIDYLDANQVAEVGIYRMHCPMAEADWLETDEKLDNPYMGKQMLECGEVVQTF